MLDARNCGVGFGDSLCWGKKNWDTAFCSQRPTINDNTRTTLWLGWQNGLSKSLAWSEQYGFRSMTHLKYFLCAGFVQSANQKCCERTACWWEKSKKAMKKDTVPPCMTDWNAAQERNTFMCCAKLTSLLTWLAELSQSWREGEFILGFAYFQSLVFSMVSRLPTIRLYTACSHSPNTNSMCVSVCVCVYVCVLQSRFLKKMWTEFTPIPSPPSLFQNVANLYLSCQDIFLPARRTGDYKMNCFFPVGAKDMQKRWILRKKKCWRAWEYICTNGCSGFGWSWELRNKRGKFCISSQWIPWEKVLKWVGDSDFQWARHHRGYMYLCTAQHS